MKEKAYVSPEEMAALFPRQEVANCYLDSIRPKIIKRCVLIVLLWVSRAVIVTQFPEYHLVSDFDQKILDPAAIASLVTIRLSMLILGSFIYVYSCYTNFYFRSVNVIALVVVCCLIWGDMELYLMSSFGNLNNAYLAMVAFRLLPLTLLIQNYRDIRK